MKRVGEPVVHRLPYSRDTRDPGGLSGFAVIAESHLSVHTAPAVREAFVDVFSCKAFDASAVEREVAKAFSAGKCVSRVVERSRQL